MHTVRNANMKARGLMPSFDVVNKIDLQKLDDAVNIANRKIASRYDFKGAHILLELNKKDKTLKIEVPDDMKLKALQEILLGALLDRGLSGKLIDWGKREEASLGAIRMLCKLKEGIDKDSARTVVAKIKELDLKVKASIQGDEVRVEGKQIDDLQECIKALRGLDLPVALQFVNMKG